MLAPTPSSGSVRRLTIILGVAVVLAGCGEGPSVSAPDAGADALFDGNVEDVDAGGDVPSLSGLILETTRASVPIDESALLTAEVWVAGVLADDRTPVVFEVVSGTGFLSEAGLRRALAGTEDGLATVRFLPDRPGTAVVEARATLLDGSEVSDRLALDVVGQLVLPAVALSATLGPDGTMIGGLERLVVVAEVTSPQGRAAPGVPVAFNASAGGLSASQDGPIQSSTEIGTDSRGHATVFYDPESYRGPVVLTASVPERIYGDRATAELAFGVRGAADLSLMALTPSRLGVAGSGYQETAAATYHLTRLDGTPIAGIPVSVEIVTSIDAVALQATATTDADGTALVTLQSGPRAGPFDIRATAVVEDAEVVTEDGPFWVVTTRPVTRFSSLDCTPRNAGGFADGGIEATPAATVRCAGRLVDRIRQGPGVETPVGLEAEVGSVPAEVMADVEGHFEFDWLIDSRPGDVAPFRDVDPPELRFDRDGDSESNPRDRVARVIFVVSGEEYFDDEDEDGRCDPGEGFYERGEPFIDVDDSGTRDPGESFIDAPWADNDSYDGANGVWDGDTLVWGEAVVVLSGPPTFEATGEGSDRSTYSTWRLGSSIVAPAGELSLDDGERVDLDLVLADRFGGPPNSSTRLDLSLVGCDGAVELLSDDHLEVDDEWGFDLVTVQAPTGAGWWLRTQTLNFAGGAPIRIALRNPPRGAGASCELRVDIGYGTCPDCPVEGLLDTTLSLQVE